MKYLEINNDIAINPPGADGEVEIEIFAHMDGWISEYLPFEKLEKWVKSVRAEIDRANYNPNDYL